MWNLMMMIDGRCRKCVGIGDWLRLGFVIICVLFWVCLYYRHELAMPFGGCVNFFFFTTSILDLDCSFSCELL